MNLYLISQTDVTGYDTYDSAVVAADSAKEAANIDPGSGRSLTDLAAVKAYDLGSGKSSDPSAVVVYDNGTWTRDPAKVQVKHLGTAHGGIDAGVICASFNAG